MKRATGGRRRDLHSRCDPLMIVFALSFVRLHIHPSWPQVTQEKNGPRRMVNVGG